MTLPLESIRVVDASQIFAGPYAAMLLADQGAEVIKLESPGGDGCRHLYTSPALGSFGKAFLSLNRNKRSIVADLTTPQGREVLHRLAGWADIFITNLRPAAARRFDADYEALARANPRLIYAAISAFGSRGPDAGKPGYDLVLQARAGIVGSRRMPDGTPIASAVMMSDMSCGMLLSYAVMSALWERQSTGRGRQVDIALLGMALGIQTQQLVRVEGDDTPIPGGAVSATAAPYRCADDRWLMVVTVADHQWHALCRALGMENLSEDPTFATFDGRARHSLDLSELLAAVFATRPLDEWQELLEAANVPCGPVLEREEVFDAPQVVANEMVIPTQHPAVGRVEMVDVPFKLSGQELGQRLRRPAPSLGQHSQEVLAELGYTPQESAELFASGSIQGPAAEEG